MIKVQEETTNKIEESLESFPNTEWDKWTHILL
jgi:hypothetical protein